MKIKLRDGRVIPTQNGQAKALKFLYGNAFGRFILKMLICRPVSKAAGWFLCRGISRVFIKPFIKNNNIDMSEYEDIKFRNYNQFFARHIKKGARPVDMQEQHLISPADSKLSVVPIKEDCRLFVKDTPYTVEEILQNASLAKKYEGGYALIFRLSVEDYHRYCYAVTGQKTDNTFIKGKLHTVMPIANDYYPIYKQNCREYCTVSNDVFGDVTVIEVGALLVGKIVNLHQSRYVTRGEEKGYFQFGGSTIVMLIQKDKVTLDEDILKNSYDGTETVVKFGEKIGTAIK